MTPFTPQELQDMEGKRMTIPEPADLGEEARHTEAEPAGRWRKRPVVVDAIRYEPEVASIWARALVEGIPKWVDDAYEAGTITNLGEVQKIEGRSRIVNHRLKIATLEGPIYARPGDWIIRGVKGELYACKPDVFALTYEPWGAAIGSDDTDPDPLNKMGRG